MATRVAHLIYSLHFKGFIWENVFFISLCGNTIINFYGKIIINLWGKIITINLRGNTIINFDDYGKP
jgi:hypothetical protein